MLFLLPYFIDSESQPPTHTQLNISEMEMGLAVDDKKVQCHGLAGGVFSFLGKYIKLRIL